MTTSPASFVGRLGTRPGAPVVRLVVAEGRVVEVEDHPGADVADVLRPGLVDLQVNGVGAHDLTADPAGVWEVGAALAVEGVTAFLPTLVSPSRSLVAAAVDMLAAGPPAGWVGARPLGWHLEGPFLAPGRRGAHPADRVRPVALDEVATWAPPHVRMVTLAPERPDGLAAVRALASAGLVVAAGHSEATAEQARAAIGAGVTVATHVCNAMPPLHHRAPGLAGVALVDEGVTVTVIADGRHLDPVVLALVDRAAGERVVLVSDRIATGAAPGVARLAGETVEVRAGVARTGDGALAGATASLRDDVATWARATGATEDAAWVAASTRPAAVLGIEQAAGLVVGAPADLVVQDGTGAVRRTVVGGVVAHDG